jgi:hypothetical protein
MSLTKIYVNNQDTGYEGIPLQEKGQSTLMPMSQKAITDEINKLEYNEAVNNRRILYDDWVVDEDYYTTPYLPYGNGNLIWTVSEIFDDGMLVMYDADFHRQNQSRATSTTINRSDGGAYAYLRATFKKNQVGNITVGGKIIWDNTQVDELVFKNFKDFVYQYDIVDNLNS